VNSKGQNHKVKKNEGKTTITLESRGKNTKKPSIFVHVDICIPLQSFFNGVSVLHQIIQLSSNLTLNL